MRELHGQCCLVRYALTNKPAGVNLIIAFALDTCEMFRAIRYAGKVYQNELATECRRLGYQIEHIRNNKGVIVKRPTQYHF